MAANSPGATLLPETIVYFMAGKSVEWIAVKLHCRTARIEVAIRDHVNELERFKK